MTVRDVVVSAAKRRMLRRLRSHWRHEQVSIRMALAGAAHHSHMRVTNMATQTDFVLAATYTATASSSSYATLLSLDAPAPVIKYVAPTPNVTTMTECSARCSKPTSILFFVIPQFSINTEETSAPRLVGAFLRLEGSAVPVNLTCQEQIVAGDEKSIEKFHPVQALV